MPETPDFEQIAARLLRLTIDNYNPQWNAHMRVVTEQLRQVWNARGAADLAAVKRELLGTCADASHSDPDNSGQCIKCGVVLDYMEPGERGEQLERAVRTLDR